MIQDQITGKTFAYLEDIMVTYGETIFEKTSSVFFSIFTTFYVCRLIWLIAQKTTLGKGLGIEDIIKPICICAFLAAVMNNVDYVRDWVVMPAKDFAIGLATMTAALTTEDIVVGSGVVDMLNLVDQRLNQVVFIPVQKVADAISWTQVYLHVGIMIIQGLYVFVWFLFVALMIEALFRFMTFFAISPLIIISYFFEGSKPIFIAGLRSLLHGVLSMFMAGIAMGMTVAVISFNPDLFLIPGMKEISSDWIFSAQYFTLILIAMISISFHLKAPKISANLSNIDDGPGAAATVAGLGTAAFMTGKTLASRAAVGTSQYVGRKTAYFANSVAQKSMKTASSVATSAMDGTQSLYEKITGK